MSRSFHRAGLCADRLLGGRQNIPFAPPGVSFRRRGNRRMKRLRVRHAAGNPSANDQRLPRRARQ